MRGGYNAAFRNWRDVLVLCRREDSWKRLSPHSMTWLPCQRSRAFSSILFASIQPSSETTQPVEPLSAASRLMQQSVQWLQEPSSTHPHNPSSRRQVAMAQSLLQQWYNSTSNDMATRFTSLILQRWLLERRRPGDASELWHHLHRVLHLWQRHAGAKNRAHDLLQSFHQYSIQRNEPRLRPAPKAYSMVFESLSHQLVHSDVSPAARVEMTATADALLQQLHEQYRRPQEPPWLLADLVVAQNSYLHFCVKSRQDPERSEEFLLQEMIQPDVKSFSAVLQHWVAFKAPDRACALLQYMLRMNLAPDRVCFNICLQGLGQAGRGAPAQALLAHMRQDPQLQPDAYSYLSVIHAWARGQAPDRAVRVAEEMLAQPSPAFASALGHTVLDAVARLDNSGPLVEAMLSRMEASRQAYTIAIRAWGNTRAQWDAPDRATELLRSMHDREDLAPCTIAYTSLIHAWAQSERNEAPQRALTIFRHMEQLHFEQIEHGTKRLVSPDTIALNSVLSAFARHGQADEAHQLLDEMKRRMLDRGDSRRVVPVHPNVISWATVIQAYINSGRSDTDSHAFDLLVEIEGLYEASGDANLRPTPDIYALVILAQNRNVATAESILWRMVDRYGECRSPARDAPNTFVCNALLRRWSTSDDPVAPQRAEAILRWMEDQRVPNLAPDASSFQLVMDAWSRSRRRNAPQHIRLIEARRNLKYPHLRAEVPV